MSEFKEFLHMGGYASYVWSAYAITFVVLLVNVLVTRAQFRKTQKLIARKAQRNGKK